MWYHSVTGDVHSANAGVSRRQLALAWLVGLTEWAMHHGCLTTGMYARDKSLDVAAFSKC